MSRRWSGRSFPGSDGHRSTFQVGLQARRVLKVASSEGGSLGVGAQHLHPLQVGALQNKSTVTQERMQEEGSFGSPQTYVQVGAGQIRPLQVGAAQVGVHQVAAAEVGHLEVDVAEVEAGQIGAAEVKTLNNKENG